jgi:NitT/TauT family transport system substrate-binding protein
MIGKMKYKSIEQLNNSLYEVLAQFKGKTIGVTSKGSIHEVILSHYLETYKLHEEIDVKYYGQAEFIAVDMKKGILEGGVGTPALAVFALTILNSHLVIQPQYLWEYNPSYGIFFHENLIEINPELVTKFLIHHKEASYLLRNSPTQAAEIISQTFEIVNKNYASSVLEISPKYCISLPEGYVHSTMEFVKTLYDLGYITRSLKIEEIFNFKFVNQIHPEQEHY